MKRGMKEAQSVARKCCWISRGDVKMVLKWVGGMERCEFGIRQKIQSTDTERAERRIILVLVLAFYYDTLMYHTNDLNYPISKPYDREAREAFRVAVTPIM